MNRPRLYLGLTTLLGSFALGACTAVPVYQPDPNYALAEAESMVRAPHPTAIMASTNAAAVRERRKSAKVQIELINTEQDFDAITYDPDNMVGDFDIPITRERLGARFAFGGRGGRGYVQFFQEDYGVTNGIMPADLFGLGGGVDGDPIVGRAGENVNFLVPYRAGINLVYGDEAVNSNTIDANAYIEVELEVGFGVEFFGVRIAGGIYNSSIAGAQEDEFTSANDASYDGNNLGTFVEAGYKHPDVPVYGVIRLESGDVEQDPMFAIGVAF